MQQKLLINGVEYDANRLSEEAKRMLQSLNFVNNRIVELENLQSLLNKAKNAYIETLRNEILSNKSGFIL